MAREADVARGTCTNATQHARLRGRVGRADAVPRWRVAGTDAWQGPRESTQTPEGAPRGE